ncbi:MAG: ATP-dependent helicase UvrD/PcrA [Solirubrobacterales bacterium]|jgi:DNA helicase-2/ATP-dependent DNA helicase PcrA|nr:ATP-dependent helicase UvrD/PcrA [Solirubrobacterales bacterium]
MLALAETQQRAVAHDDGPLLLVGAPGSGKTEALARRLARLADDGVAPDRVLILCSTRATARRLQQRAEALLNVPYEELWIGNWETLCGRLLRRHSTAAGLDPFFDVLGPAERLAILLERLEELPLRNQEIRGNPTGLLARLLSQVDELKAGAELPEPELAEFCAAHDRILAESGSLDQADVFLALGKLLHERPDICTEIASCFANVMVDEYEDTTPAQRSILERLAGENRNHVYALEIRDKSHNSHDLDFDGEVLNLEERFRTPAVRRWRCSNERAQAQAVAREAEHLLAGGASPETICVLVDDPASEGGAVAAAMEERGVTFHLSGPAALFQRPEVRDAIAWLRVLADPEDSPAAARALTRPPIELRAADLARLTTIARRRKVDLVSACEAALESPQIPPEGRERIQGFLKLYGEASAAIEERRADVFVRRLIERVGLRRQRLYAAEPEVAERLLGLSRLADLATTWARREPHGSTRDFVRYLSAVAEAGVEPAGGEEPASPGAVQGLARSAAKGTSFDHVFVLGPGSDPIQACSTLILSRIARESEEGSEAEEAQEEELFGPAEGLHATYRKLREEVLEASWRAGRELSEPRLDTVVDVNRAIARHLELLKLAALAQRPGEEATAEAVEAVNGLLRQVATPEQQAELDASPLDAYLLDSERERDGRRRLIAARHEPSLEAFLPRRGDGALSLSASDLDLYLTCPLKYKFRRVFGIPQEPTINQRFGILVHNVLERFHKESSEGGEDDIGRLMELFEAGWRRSGFGASDDELQFRDRARGAMRLYWQRESESESEPVWLERKFDIRIGPHHVRGRVDRVDRLPDGTHELIDYKTGERKSEAALENDLQLALYRLAAREAWGLEAGSGSYYYVLDAEKVAAPTKPDDAERVKRTVLAVGEGVLGQDFEPRPSPTTCGWCDYRLICPAAES